MVTSAPGAVGDVLALKAQMRNADNARAPIRFDRITFACDLTGRYNPYPMVEPIVKETKFC